MLCYGLGGCTKCSDLGRECEAKKECLDQERRKLEEMVAADIQEGHHNLGANLKVLAQSRAIDKLIVNDMLKDTHITKYNNK